MDGADAAVARRAIRQHGLVTRSDASAAGMTRSQVRHRVATGRWSVVGDGVYRITGSPVTWESEVLARVLTAGPGAVASHRTAAVLWGLDGARRGRPEITLPRGRRATAGEAARAHWSTDLHLITPVPRSGIPTTPIGRTLLDLGAVVPLPRLHLAIDDARRRGLTDWDRLIDVLVLHARRGRRGAGPLRAVLDSHAAEVTATESGFERLVVASLVSAGLPAPVLQHPVVVSGRHYRLDLAYPAQRLGIELDGSVHLRRDVWEADHVRQNALVIAGWTVLRFTWRDYTQRAAGLVAEVRGALAAAA